ncbi:uncharacterized protein LOC133038930 [Cannabis sativa]|uniref:uncharacterized protein LOC133038930 n=1 Tax=Cannabis sativa TaxID=3483 RepID=UPI0029CA3217|nr:uncharacterized protein LOC133038930 [Cannabis sativa]
MFNGDYLLHLSSMYNQEEFELLICIMWGIWSDRNRIFHGGQPRPRSSIVVYVTNFHQDFIRAKLTKVPSAATEKSRPHTVTNNTMQKEVPWTPPAINGFKMNVDAGTNLEQKKLGVGAIIRDHEGKVVAALSKIVQGSFRSDEMEAKSLFHALNWASQLQYPVTHIETDALRVSSAILSNATNLSSFSDLIFDVRCLISSFPGILISHVKRTANQAAHGLAKFALGLDEDMCWVGEIPYPIFSVVVNDFNL